MQLLSGSLEYVSIQYETLKNEKFLLDIVTKRGDIANKILNAAIDAERTFKCKWVNVEACLGLLKTSMM